MNKKVLIVEDQFVEANDIRIMLQKAGYEVCGIARSVEAALEIVSLVKPGLVLLDIFLQGSLTGIDLAFKLNKINTPFIYLSANSNEEILSAAKTTEPYGFIVKPFREKDLLVTLEIARYRHEHSHEARFRREAETLRQLEEIASANYEWQDILLQTGKVIQQEIPFDFFAIDFESTAQQEKSFTGFLRIGFDEYQAIGLNELSTISKVPKDELLRRHLESTKITSPVFFDDVSFGKFRQSNPLKATIWDSLKMRSQLSFPLVLDSVEIFSLCFYSRRPDAYHADHIALLSRLQKSLVNIVALKHRSSKVKMGPFPDERTVSSSGFAGIIGNSHLLLNVFDLVSQVAPFDTSVLLLGESGTGKEKIAECIHDLSPRNGKPLIKVNCATLPATLIESELFGHEKGSFTGATDRRIGKFELANGGTIFLDEIGEMPVDLQVKLLRVLQEKEIEPIGGKAPIKINVRVIAATNRNLEREVGEGRFRLDLYYRLNVFPIILPPLRERLEDIPALAKNFITIYNRKSGKKIDGLSPKVIENMMAYNWPGNIRELENLIERAVLLSKGSTIENLFLAAPELMSTALNNQNSSMKSIHENEKDHIISALKKCKGKIYGAGGAAELLKIPGSTLKSKMNKLGIEKPDREQ